MRAIPLLLAAATACGDPLVAPSTLAVIALSPANGSTGVSPAVAPAATFSEPLVPDSVADGTFHLLDEDGAVVDATIHHDDEWVAVALVPEAELDEGAEYTFEITTGVEGRSSGALRQVVRSTFTVAGGDTGADEATGRPVADAGDDLRVRVGEPAVLDGSGSTDPDGDPLTFAWSVIARPDGSLADLDDPASPTPTLVPDVEGTYVVQLVVNDGEQDSRPDFAELEATAGNAGTP